ncbi:MAG: ATP-grasp domain-containing protein [Spirochaetales bacterium]|nr:ATP-grasp domain-containing protein [Spirochaetales bacterium]
MDKKSILILGGGSSQINLIKKSKSMGLFTILADINPDAPGRKFCSKFEKVSTFDYKGALKAAEKNSIDAVATAGTDQPVFTSAYIAHKLSLPQFLTPEKALAVTNKKYMKAVFKSAEIKTADYILLDKNSKKTDIQVLKPPFVLKPLDSQGQRGVMKLNTCKDVLSNIEYALSFSRETSVILEEYYDSDEITLSGWVKENRLYILSVTDRVTFNNLPSIGICSSHQYPSAYVSSRKDEIIRLTENIIKAFKIENGPIYFQYLIGKDGIYVNEIACRLGGAYEDEFMPHASGIDIAEILIKGSLGEKIPDKIFSGIKPSALFFNGEYFTTLLLFSKPGLIKQLSFPDYAEQDNNIISAKFIINSNVKINPVANSTQRAGYAILKNCNINTLNSSIKQFIDNTKIIDDKGLNLLISDFNLLSYKTRRRFSV